LFGDIEAVGSAEGHVEAVNEIKDEFKRKMSRDSRVKMDSSQTKDVWGRSKDRLAELKAKRDLYYLIGASTLFLLHRASDDQNSTWR